MKSALRFAASCALAGLLLCACDSGAVQGKGSRGTRTLKVQRDEADLQQCLTHPDPVGYSWTRAIVAAFCADQFTNAITKSDVTRMIDAGQGRQLDVEFDAILDDFEAGKLPEGSARRAYTKIFENTDEPTGALIERWLEQSPSSAHALAARGIHRVERAGEVRGERLAKDTPQGQFESMFHWLKLAQPDLEKAIDADPRILAAHESLIHLATLASQDALADRVLVDALKIDPTGFYVRASYSVLKQPRWSGSLREMDEVAAEAEKWLSQNPRLAGLRAMALVERATPYLRDNKYQDALREFERGLAICPSPSALEFAGRLALKLQRPEHAIELFSQALRFRPDDRDARLNRANSYRELKKFAAATADLKQQLERDPNDLWVVGQLAWIYIYETHDPKAAEPLVAQLLEKEPKSGAAWLMRADVIHDLEGPGLREAAENFVRYIDRSNEWQSNALPRVEAWLAWNPAR